MDGTEPPRNIRDIRDTWKPRKTRLPGPRPDSPPRLRLTADDGDHNPLAYIGRDRPHTPLLDAIRATAEAKNRAWSEVAGPALIRMAHLAADLERRSAAVLDPVEHAEFAESAASHDPVLATLSPRGLQTVVFDVRHDNPHLRGEAS